ncbi:PDZ domain-containing protein [Coralloluteibacterium thermophilus]|uniref:PDZ domain-containing protein n=1 Tax=Coralloluteibacterium thermophilum TaxID=2707049 RepID=A0ABV9NPZ9_9GAMM
MLRHSLFLLAAVLLAPLAVADERPAAALLRSEIDAALLRVADAHALADDADGPLLIEQPARTRYELGAVIDVRERTGDGLPVLAVTPGGAAERMGLRTGDRLLAINGHRLAGGVDAEALADAVGADGGPLDVEVRRDGAALRLHGAAERVELPAYRLSVGGASGGDSRCGRINTFDVAPRGRHIYPAILIAVDGRSPGPTTADSFRVEPGRRTLTVAENIDVRQLSTLTQQLRSRGGRARYKTLEVDVEAGTTYLLGARFDPSRGGSTRNDYWEPVIWRQVAERCR